MIIILIIASIISAGVSTIQGENDYIDSLFWIYDSEILTKDKYLSLIEKKLGDEFDAYSDFVNYVWDNYIFDPHTDFFDLCIEHKIPSDIQNKLDDIIWHCQHEENPIELLDTAKKKEVNGSIVYVTCWEKYC